MIILKNFWIKAYFRCPTWLKEFPIIGNWIIHFLTQKLVKYGILVLTTQRELLQSGYIGSLLLPMRISKIHIKSWKERLFSFRPWKKYTIVNE